MAEFVGGEPISVGADEPITFENKTDDCFSVDVGIVFHKSGLYRVTVDGKHTSVEIEPERKTGTWIDGDKLMMMLADWWYSSFGEEETDEAKAIYTVMDQVEKIVKEMNGCEERRQE